MRQEYVMMYERLVKAAELDAKGVVVTGQPGIGEWPIFPTIMLLKWFIGKSLFGIYVLLRRIAEDEDVMYAFIMQDLVIQFHAGAARVIVDMDKCWDLTDGLIPAMRPWMLIEPGVFKPGSTIPHYLLHQSLFRVAFLSPEPARMKSLGPHLFHVWVMRLWTEDEIGALYVRRAFCHGCDVLIPVRWTHKLLSNDVYRRADAAGEVPYVFSSDGFH